MTIKKLPTPIIYQPQWLQKAHAKLSPVIERASAQQASRDLKFSKSRREAAWHYAAHKTHTLSCKAYGFSDVIFGDASYKTCGLLGHVAYGVSSVAGGILSAPVLLSFDADTIKSASRGIQNTLLKPLGVPALLGAVVGLVLKAAMMLAIMLTVPMLSHLYYSLTGGRGEDKGLPDIEMRDLPRPSQMPDEALSL